MPDLTIQCPKCHHQFPLSEAMTSQIEEHLKQDFDDKLQSELAKAKEVVLKEASQAAETEKEVLQASGPVGGQGKESERSPGE